ncbi:MAG: type II secretion system F family protein [Candidatus Bathyarchaeia archaeon]
MVPKRLRARLAGLRKNLDKASIRLTFEAYVGLMVFAALVAGAAMFSLSFILLAIGGNLIVAFAFAVLLGLLAAFVSAGVCIVYPLLEISSRARKIDANLPMIANFMSVLASAGMPPERIVRSLANVGDEFAVGKEVRRIIADIELLGLDLRAALKNASLRAPSKSFANLLDGVVTTSYVGGDLAAYLREEADKYKKARVQTMKGFLENLGTVAEAYISFMIALPLALIVMLSVMAFVGGGALIAGLDPQVLLLMLTFLVTPAGVGIMLLLVDSLTPPR